MMQHLVTYDIKMSSCKFARILFLLLSLFGSFSAEIINTKVLKYVDVSMHLTKSTTRIAFECENDFSRVYKYIRNEKNGFISFQNGLGESLRYLQTNSTHYDVYYGNDCVIVAFEVDLGRVANLLRRKTMTRANLVEYKANNHHYSQYITKKYDAVYYINSNFHSNLKDIIPLNATAASYSAKNLPKYSVQPFNIVYAASKPHHVVTRLEREIDVSHLGQIGVKDIVYIANRDATHYGPFIHLERRTTFVTYLPVLASNIRLFDETGDRYNLRILEEENQLVLIFGPRYFLLGGWKTNYILTYSLPTYAYLQRDRSDASFVLQMSVFDHVANDVVIEQLMTKVILPENAQPSNVESSFKELPWEKLHTALGFGVGRSVVIFTGANLLDYQISDFRIVYLYSDWLLLLGPLKLILYCYAIFLSIIFGNRYSHSVKLHDL